MWFWILLIILIVLLVGSVPAYPYSHVWGYGPSGGVGLLIAILLILLLLGVIQVPGCRIETEGPAPPPIDMPG